MALGVSVFCNTEAKLVLWYQVAEIPDVQTAVCEAQAKDTEKHQSKQKNYSYP